MPISPLPTAPSRGDAPDLFNDRMDARLAAEDQFVTEANELEENVNAAEASILAMLNLAGFTGTDTVTSVAIGTGSKSWTIQTGRAFVPGSLITARYNASNYMWGIVDTYTSGTGALTATIAEVVGSGTYANWTISLAGPVGPAGTASIVKASAAEIVTGTDDDKFITAKGLVDSKARVTMTTGGSFTPDCSNDKFFDILLNANITLEAPSSTKDGCTFLFCLRQPPSGGPYTLTKASGVKKGTDLNLTLSTAANAVDYVGGVIRGSTLEILGFTPGVG